MIYLRTNQIAVRVQTNKALELTPAVGARLTFSCHAGCLRSREMNRASSLRADEQSLARLQLNFFR
jgi:hypothetical protein